MSPPLKKMHISMKESQLLCFLFVGFFVSGGRRKDAQKSHEGK
jgi:hypothetical protein